MAGTLAQLQLGSRWRYGAHVYEVRAFRAIEDAPPDSSQRMVLATPVGEPPHPFDWVPETSFCREWTPEPGQ